jgi:hypothetical protein
MKPKPSKERVLEILRAEMAKWKSARDAVEQGRMPDDAHYNNDHWWLLYHRKEEIQNRMLEAIYDAVVFGRLKKAAAGREVGYSGSWVEINIGRTGDWRYRRTPQFKRDKRAYLKKMG